MKVETASTQNYNNISKDQADRLIFYPQSSRTTGISENFTIYLERLNLAGDPNLLVLSSSNHYYYEEEDLKNVKTVINVKQFNHINQIGEFLENIYSILPSRSYLIGCFSDNEDQNRFLSDSHKPNRKIAGEFDLAEYGIASRNPILNMFYNILDIKTNRYCTKKTVKRELETANWKMMDMTEIKGLTYFCAQKVLLD